MNGIGLDVYQGLFTKAEFNGGRGRTPGSIVNIRTRGDSKIFVAVKLASGNWKNGCLVQLDSAGVTGTATTVSAGAGLNDIGRRLGVLIFSTNTSTTVIQTMAGTAFGYAQIYGLGVGQVLTASAVGQALTLGASAGQLGSYAAQATASAMIVGINLAATTASVVGIVQVMLNYPHFVPGVTDD